ncbi:RHS repeat-associated core domain-containing protein [Marinobacter sp. 1Y8]
MSINKLFLGILSVWIIAFSAIASAAPWTDKSHEIYRIDYDGDGVQDDLLVEGVKRSIEIPYDIAVELASEFSSYVLQKNDDGTYELIQLPPGTSFQGEKHAVNGDVNLITQDLNNDGVSDHLIQSVSGAGESFYIYASESEEPLTLASYTSGGTSGNVPQPANYNVVSYPKPASLAGETSGQFSVDQTGAATYNLPLKLAPGLNGHQPKLAINYNNRAGNGILGMGWHLSGMQSIQRCSTTRAHGEEKFNGVTLSDSDRLCMGGNRLIQIDGDGYWAENARYRLELDSLVEITREDEDFKVTRRDGSYARFTAIKPELWLIESDIDPFGTEIKYSYSPDSSTSIRFYPSQINYGEASVHFTYQRGRNDFANQYLSGQKRSMDRFLKSIEVNLGGLPIRRYNLHYEYRDISNALSLKHIQECGYASDGSKSQCVLPLDIVYEDQSADSGLKEFPLPSRFNPDQTESLRTMDWDGDGFEDLVRTGNDGSVEIRYGAKSGEQPQYEQLAAANEARYMVTPFIASNGERGIVYLTGKVEQEYYENPIEPGYHELIAQPVWKDLGYTCNIHKSCSTGWVAVDIPGYPDYWCDGDIHRSTVYASTSNPPDEYGRRWKKRECSGTSEDNVNLIGTAVGYYAASYKYHEPVFETTPHDWVSFKYKWHKDTLGSDGTWAPRTLGNGDRDYKICLPKEDASDFNPAEGFYQPVTGDMDGDKKLDIYVAEPGCEEGGTDPKDEIWRNVLSEEVSLKGSKLSDLNSVYFLYDNEPDTELLERKDGLFYVLNGSESQRLETKTGKNIPSTGSVVSDINSDGLSDIINFGAASSGGLSSNSVSVFINTGGEYSDAYTLDYSSIPGMGASLGEILDLTKETDRPLSSLIREIDFDNNGLIDLLVINGSEPGNSSFSNKVLIFKSVKNESGEIVFQIEDSGFSVNNTVEIEERLKVFDADGDGVSDILIAEGSTYKLFGRFNSIGNSAVGFSNTFPTGEVKSFSIEYSRLNDQSVHDVTRMIDEDLRTFSSPMQVVKSVSKPVSKDISDAVSFHYKNSKIDISGRGFLGFESFTKESYLNKRKEAFYFEGSPVGGDDSTFPQFPYIGKLLAATVENTSNGAVISVETYSWDSVTTTSSDRVFRPYLAYSFSQKNDLAGNVVKSIETMRTLDDYGYLSKETRKTGYATANPLDCYLERNCSFRNIEYLETTNYTFDAAFPTFLSKKEITTSVPSSAIVGSELEKQIVEYVPHEALSYVVGKTITSSGFGADDAVVLTKEYELGEPHSGQLKSNVVSSGDGVSPINRIQERKASLDSYQFGVFPTRHVNPLGFVETMVFDYRSGQPEKVITKNGNIETFSYDPFGRKVREDLSTGMSHSFSYEFCGRAACPAYTEGAVYKTTQAGNDGSEKYSYFDAFGNNVAVAKKGYDGNTVVVQSVFDNRGRLVKKSKPYFEGDLPNFVEYDYKDSQNKVTVTEPSGASTVTTITGNGMGKVTETRHFVTKDDLVTGAEVQGKQVVRKETSDVRGNIVTIVEAPESGREVTTTIDYDAKARLIRSVVNDSEFAKVTKVSVEYQDELNKKILNDPDVGIIETVFNTAGEVVQETSKGLDDGGTDRTTSYSYDQLGRLVEKGGVTSSDTAYWYYDVDASGSSCGKGRLCQKKRGDFSERYEYDQKGHRVSSKTEIRTASSSALREYDFQYSYDHIGREKSVIYPSGFSVQREYRNGYQSKIMEIGASGQITELWAAQKYDVFGSVERAELGNGLAVTRIADENGLPKLIQAELSATAGFQLQAYRYGYDSLGNLVSRQNDLTHEKEIFAYDGLSRLVSEALSYNGSTTTKVHSYDGLGNILSKGAVNNYRYGDQGYTASGVCDVAGSYPYPGPHAAIQVANNVYCYDEFGNMLRGGGNELVYNSNNQPTAIRSEESDAYFRYGPDDARYYQRKTSPEGVTETFYVAGGRFEDIIENGERVQKSYLDGLVINKRSADGSEELLYTLRDHLGSVDMVVDSDARDDAIQSTMESLAYSPFGQRRLDARATTTLLPLAGNRGFTDHEHLDDVGLIHMNGRVYDPLIGRFLSADPLIQAPYASQSYNRYSYVWNNPLSSTDPSGYGVEGMIPLNDSELGESYVAIPQDNWSVNNNFVSVVENTSLKVEINLTTGDYGIATGAVSDIILDTISEDYVQNLVLYDAQKGGGWLNNFQTSLDVAGLTPAIGIFADGLNTLISAGRGDWAGAGLSAMAMVPILGQGATGAKLASKALEITPAVNKKLFRNVRGCKAQCNIKTGEIWEKDLLHKNQPHFEVYKNLKNFQKGKRNRAVWDDGRLKQEF